MAHLPAAVTYPVGVSRWARGLLVLMVVAWAVSLGIWAWWWRTHALPGAWWLSLLVGLSLLISAVWRARQPLFGQLQWAPGSADRAESAEWRWHSASYRHGTPLDGVTRVLDLQSSVLVRAHTRAGLGLWLWLEQDQEPEHWLSLRQALQAAT